MPTVQDGKYRRGMCPRSTAYREEFEDEDRLWADGFRRGPYNEILDDEDASTGFPDFAKEDEDRGILRGPYGEIIDDEDDPYDTSR